MRIVNVPLLRIARAFGLVRGVRLVRVRDDRRRMCWAVALRVLGGWYVLGRDSMTSPWVIQRDPWRNPQPLLFPSVRSTRRLLASLNL